MGKSMENPVDFPVKTNLLTSPFWGRETPFPTAARTAIVLDWDDTLFPLTHVRGRGWSKVKVGLQEPSVISSGFRSSQFGAKFQAFPIFRHSKLQKT